MALLDLVLVAFGLGFGFGGGLNTEDLDFLLLLLGTVLVEKRLGVGLWTEEGLYFFELFCTDSRRFFDAVCNFRGGFAFVLAGCRCGGSYVMSESLQKGATAHNTQRRHCQSA